MMRRARRPALRCPHCWTALQPATLHQRCPDACGADATTFRAGPACPHGRPPTSALYCPAPGCGRRLERDYIDTPARIIAVVGSSESGKSTYVGVLVNELRNRVGEAFDDASVELVGDASRDRYREVFGTYLYEQGRTLRRTDSIRALHALEPLLFMLRFPRRGRLSGRERLMTGITVFYDTAGEDILDADRRGRLSRYLAAADGIVFVLDPLQVPSVRDAVSGAEVLPAVTHDQVEMVQGVAETLRESSPGSQIATPLALVVAKTDALVDLLPPATALTRQGPHYGAYDETDGQQVHDEMRAVVHGWTNGSTLINLVQNSFADHRFFGVSALGFPPESSDQLSPQGIHPLRVEDPMLWLLARFGLVPVRGARR
jgi:Double-GTPase 2